MNNAAEVRKLVGDNNKTVGNDYKSNQNHFHLPNNANNLESMVKDSFDYFINEINYYRSLLYIYKNATLDCFYKMEVEDRTEVSKTIVKKEKLLQKKHYKPLAWVAFLNFLWMIS